MFAFAASAAPALRTSAFTASARSVSPARAPAARPAVVCMADKSPSMPFMNAPEGIPADTPGYAGFDPLGFIDGGFDLKFMQEAEIKHGRVCMLAVLGLVVPEIFTFPFYSAPKGALAASTEMHDYFVNQGALKQLVLWTHFAEVFGAIGLRETLNGDRVPGYFGLDPLNFAGAPGTPKFAKFQLNEIKNGRLAMCAVGGIIHQQFVTHQPTLFNLTHFKGFPTSF